MGDYRPSSDANARDRRGHIPPQASRRQPDLLEKIERKLPLLLCAAVLLLLVLPVLDPSLQLYDRDTARCEAPFKWELWKRLQAHQLPLWVTWTEAGTSLLGQMTPGLFHPTTLLYLLPFDFETLFKLQHLLALPVAALGFFLFARWSGAGRFGATGGALAYAGSGWVVSMAGSNLHYALGAAAVPFALHGLARFLETRRPLWLLAGAFALACPVLGGDPQSALFAGLAGAGLTLGFRARQTSLHANHWHTNLFPRVASFAVWGLCALLLSASAALPVSLRLSGLASAPGLGATRDAYSAPLWRLPGLAIPGAFDETLETTDAGQRSPYGELAKGRIDTPFSQGITLGAPLLLLGLFATRRKRGWLLGAGLVCVLASSGPALFVDGLLLRIFPPLSWFRYPEKWLAPATFLLAMAGALGATELFEAEGDKASTSRKGLLGAAGSVVAFAFAALLLSLFDGRALAFVTSAMRDRPVATAALFLSRLRSGLWIEAALLAALAGLLALRTRREGPFAAIFCAVLLGVSALANSQSLLYTMPIELLRGPVPIDAVLRARADLTNGPLRLDSASEEGEPLTAHNLRLGLALFRMNALASEDNAFRGVENVASYSSLQDAEYERLFREAPETLHRLFDVQFQLRASIGLGDAQRARDGWEAMPLGLSLRQWPSSPRAFLVGCAEALGPEAAIQRLSTAGLDPHHVAIARPEDQDALADLACAADATTRPARWTRPSPEQLEVDTESRAPALLVVAEHFDPGWSVSIDGANPVPALQLDRAALGAKIPAGKHHLVFRFFPRGLSAGLACSIGCALLLLLLELLRLRFRRA
jgi:hypothetical protein